MFLSLRINRGGVFKGWKKNRIFKLIVNLVELEMLEGYL